MTDGPALAETSTRRRAPRGSGTPGLYEPVGWVLVRAPLLCVDAYLAIGSADEPSPHDPLVRTALAVGSRDLLAQLDRSGSLSAKEAQRVRLKFVRYLIRMSTRPTPYGMFACVGLAQLDNATDLRIADTPPLTRTRPDMEWLLALVARLEARPEVRRELRSFANPAVLLHGGRAYLDERAGLGDLSAAAPVGIRATSAVRRALALARTPVSRELLAEELLATPGATPDKIERLLTELWEQTFLLTELRPPLTHPAPARTVAARLAGVAPATDERAALVALLDAMTAWDELAISERASAYRSLDALAAGALPDCDHASAQVDTALELEGSRLHEAIGREAARAAELLLRLSPSAGLGQLDAYRTAFAGRYGSDREVPLLELLDPASGLGPPNRHGAGGRAIDRAKLNLRIQTLRSIALDALRDRRLTVTLDRDTLDSLTLSAPTAQSAPVSLDLAVFVLATSAAAIDAGDFELLVGPNLGAQEAGRNLGRFGDLLGAAGSDALTAAAAAGARHYPDDVAAELVYLPRRGRSANVAIRPAIHAHEIAVGTMPGVAPANAIALSDVLIGIRDGRFYARTPALAGDLRVHAGHMLNSHQAPAAVRFLEDLARDGRMLLTSFDWGPAAELPFVPRVRSGRIVLAPAQWTIDRATRDRNLDPSQPDFAGALADWREAWMVPRYVYLTAADNRLLLDLDAPEHVEQLREELPRLADGGVLVLQEPLPGVEHAWLAGPGGGHLTELVVPLALRPSTQGTGERPRPATAARPRTAPSDADRLRPPGSDWLFAKLYCARDVEEDLLAGPIRAFCQFAAGGGFADCWFFLRYADPDPHLRLRFRGAPDRLLGELLPNVCAWAGELIADGSCQRVCFDTYEREIERYGGLAAIGHAEALFAADSAAVVELLRLARDELPTIDRTALAVLSVDGLLDTLGLDAAQRLEWYRAAVSVKHLSGDDYRERQRVLRRLLSDPAGYSGERGGTALARVLAARRATMTPIVARLRQLGDNDRLDAALDRVCESYVHLHCNRLLGAEGPTEQHVLGLLLRTREGLDRAPATPPR